MSELTYEEYRDLVLRAEAERHARAVEALAGALTHCGVAQARASRLTRRVKGG